MPHRNPLPINSEKLIHWIFTLGTLYFIVTTLYSLYFFKEKFILDGFSIVFDVANQKWFSYCAQREVMHLQQIIPVTLSVLGVQLKYVMLGYIFNTYLLYYLLFAFIVVKLKDWETGIFYLLVCVAGDPYNYFLMVEELLPGACMAITVISLVKQRQHITSTLFYIGTLFCTFYVVHSHPLSTLCLITGIIMILLTKHGAIIFKNSLLFLLIALIIILLIKMATLNAYDQNMLTHRKGVIKSLNELTTARYIGEVLYYIFFSRITFCLITICTLAYLLAISEFKKIAVVIVLVCSAVFLVNLKANFTEIKLWDLDYMLLDRWTLPIRFIVFGAFSMYCLHFIATRFEAKLLVISLMLMCALSFVRVEEDKERATFTVQHVEGIIKACRKQRVTKCMIDDEQYSNYAHLHKNVYHDALVLSSIPGPSSSVQVVYASDSIIAEVESLDSNKVWLMDDIRVINTSQLNKDYFNIENEPYLKIQLEETH